MYSKEEVIAAIERAQKKLGYARIAREAGVPYGSIQKAAVSNSLGPKYRELVVRYLEPLGYFAPEPTLEEVPPLEMQGTDLLSQLADRMANYPI